MINRRIITCLCRCWFLYEGTCHQGEEYDRWTTSYVDSMVWWIGIKSVSAFSNKEMSSQQETQRCRSKGTYISSSLQYNCIVCFLCSILIENNNPLGVIPTSNSIISHRHLAFYIPVPMFPRSAVATLGILKEVNRWYDTQYISREF